MQPGFPLSRSLLLLFSGHVYCGDTAFVERERGRILSVLEMGSHPLFGPDRLQVAFSVEEFLQAVVVLQSLSLPQTSLNLRFEGLRAQCLVVCDLFIDLGQSLAQVGVVQLLCRIAR